MLDRGRLKKSTVDYGDATALTGGYICECLRARSRESKTETILHAGAALHDIVGRPIAGNADETSGGERAIEGHNASLRS